RASKSRPEFCSCAPGRCGHGNVGQLAGELVEAIQAPVRADAQKLAPELVVRNFGNQNIVVDDRACQPGANVGILAWMADLAEDGGVEQQPHERDGSAAAGGAENAICSTWSMSQSGSSEMSSAAHRSNIAATRAACSARTTSHGKSAGLAVTANK